MAVEGKTDPAARAQALVDFETRPPASHSPPPVYRVLLGRAAADGLGSNLVQDGGDTLRISLVQL